MLYTNLSLDLQCKSSKEQFLLFSLSILTAYLFVDAMLLI